MTLQWIPLDDLAPHPENSNRMPPHLLAKLKAHIKRTGLYEPLVVRPMGAPSLQYQILNGHHRVQVLRDLGHTHARCDVWLVNDDDARMLLATLNRLEGRDDPSARARLVVRLAEGRSPEDLARLLPEPPEAIERLRRLAQPPPDPADPASVERPARPMTFFVSDEQYALVSEALRECGTRSAERGTNDNNGHDFAPPAAVQSAIRNPQSAIPSSRADALERLAQWYLEAQRLR